MCRTTIRKQQGTGQAWAIIAIGLSLLCLTLAPAQATAAQPTAPAPSAPQWHGHWHGAPPQPIATPAPAYHADPNNPLPTGSNAANRPLPPGSSVSDYELKPYVDGQPLVLMAISGGGSRSAYYAACVMEQMSRVPLPGVSNQTLPDGRPMYSLLDSVRGISTVSAGGLASSWYVANFDERKSPDFFERMKTAMSVNLQWRTYGHMALFPPLAVRLLASSVTRTDLLADEVDSLLGGRDLTFADLAAKERRQIDPAPVLMINGTVYNSGQRLVMSNLPPSRFPSIMDSFASNITMPETDRQILRNLVQPITFADIGSDISSYQVSKALAASAAYPILLAPVPLRVYPGNVPPDLAGRVDRKLLQSSVAYVADGGLYENEGVDPLLSLLKTVDPQMPVMLIIIDASARMETMSLREGKVFGPTTVISRMYDIGTLKPLAYYSSILADYHNPDKLKVLFVRMEGYDEATQATLRDIPTQFKLSSPHRKALQAVAEQNFATIYEPLISSYISLGQWMTARQN